MRRGDPDKDDVEVRLEDQQHINTFGRLNGRMHDVEDDLKAKQSQYDLLDDAANEIILADDDEPIRCPLLRSLLLLRAQLLAVPLAHAHFAD